MSNAAQIIEQRDAGLLTAREARQFLRMIVRQAKFNADYASDNAEYQRWRAERSRAHCALNGGPQLTVINGGLDNG